MEQERLKIYQLLFSDEITSLNFSAFIKKHFATESTTKNLHDFLISKKSPRKMFYYTNTVDKFFKKYACDLFSNSTYCGGSGVVTPNPTPTGDFPPCVIKRGKVVKTPNGADVMVIKTTVWDKPSIQLYSKSTRFLVLSGEHKSKMGNYKCTQSGKLFLALDSEKKPDPIKDDPNKPTKDGLNKPKKIYVDCSDKDFPYDYRCRAPKIAEIQRCLGLEKKYQTGNFGPITKKAISEYAGIAFDDVKQITQELYDDIIYDCENTNQEIAQDSYVDNPKFPDNSAAPAIETPEYAQGFNNGRPTTDANATTDVNASTGQDLYNQFVESNNLVSIGNQRRILYKGDSLSNEDFNKLSRVIINKGYRLKKRNEVMRQDEENARYVWIRNK
jgi:hypothetical protein